MNIRLPNMVLTCVGAVLFGAVSITMAGEIVQVKNTTELGLDYTLSDLILYGEWGQKLVVKAPGDPTDDVDIEPGGTRIFDAGFEVTSYFISTQIGASELESYVLQVTQQQPRKIGMIFDPDGLEEVCLAIDHTVAPFDPFPDGQQLWVEAGTAYYDYPPTEAVPGWFVGTYCDFENGGVTNPYSDGWIQIANSDAQVTVVPEPTMLSLVTFAGLLLLRRCRA